MAILDAGDVCRYLDELQDHLTPLRLGRLRQIAELLGKDGRVSVATVLATVYPDTPHENAGTDLRKLRGALAEAVVETGVSFSCEVSSERRGGAAQRRLWFEGKPRLAERAQRFSHAETGELNHLPATLRQRGRVLGPTISLDELRDGKPVVRWFLSYAHKNSVAKERFFELVQERFACSSKFVFESWHDGDIVLGDGWRESIEQALDTCHLGVLLLSHAFLSSPFIREVELPRFVNQQGEIDMEKRAVPVCLEKMTFDRVELHGLAPKQIFTDKDGKAFKERIGHVQENWVNELVDRIEGMLDRYGVVAPGGSEPIVQRVGQPGRKADLRRAVRHVPMAERMGLRDMQDAHSVLLETAQAQVTVLEKDSIETSDSPGVDALEYLMNWLRDAAAPPLFALLAEYGMGKTITCQRLVRGLEDERRNDPELPAPIYLDLRNLTGLNQSVPVLEAIVNECIRRGWRHDIEGPPMDFSQVLKLAGEGALVIFDGLDEALVHLSESDGQVFTRELLKMLSVPTEQRPGARKPRLLISCRTHYFRSLREQKNHFTGQERGEVRANDYRALVLLPFTEKQVSEYLTRALPGTDVHRLQELIASVHNLTELTRRPYTLRLVSEFIPGIEKWRAQGKRVYGVTLYRRMVQRWLERDSGKHILKPAHKMRLMPHLAATLAREGQRLLPVARLESWFTTFLADQPDLKGRYAGIDRDKLEEDLRTATFLVRQDGSGEDDGAFRFAHSSMHEFFLADYLFQALRADDPDAWAMPMPSRETLDFIGQRLAETDDAMLLQRLSGWCRRYREHTSEILLAYALLARERGWPEPVLRGVDLRGARLRGWTIGVAENSSLDLAEADFRDANLRETWWQRVNLSGARFDEADLTRSEWVGVGADGVAFDNANLTGCRWRDTNLSGARFHGAETYRMQWMRCRSPKIEGLPEDGAIAVLNAPDRILPPVNVGTLKGDHGSFGGTCSFAPDGRRLASAGIDGTLRVWDARSGEMLLSLRRREFEMQSCAYAPDGRRLASTGSDGTVRVWDAESGELSLTLQRHHGGVESCAFAPDGGELVSAGDDGSLQVWDVVNGDRVLTLRGHEGAVRSCAYAPDGSRLVSAGDDGAVRVWDTLSGDVVLTLNGHEDRVENCVYSPDGRRLASAGHDGTVRVWDAARGVGLLTLRGHEHCVLSCAYSPDGSRLASAGDDGTVRVWDAVCGELLHTLYGHEGHVLSCAFAPDGSKLISADDISGIRVWDTLNWESLLTLRGYEGGVGSCACSMDGTRLVSAGDDGTVRVWDAASGVGLLTLRGHEGWVWSCAVAPDGTKVVSGGRDGTLRVWDAVNGDGLLTLPDHGYGVPSCVYSPDGQRLVSAGFDGTVRVWDAANGDTLFVLRGHKGWVSSCAVAPDGARVVSGGRDGTVRVWDAASGESLLTLHGHTNGVSSCAYSADGKRLVSAGDDGTLRVWNAASGEALLTLYGHEGGVRSCNYSPDGERLVSAGDDSTLRVWDAASGEMLLTLYGHESEVQSCTYSPDGKRLVSAGTDGTLQVWDAETGARLRVSAIAPEGHVVWEPNSERIIEAGGDFWRWYSWTGMDPKTGQITRFPAEYRGPLPAPSADFYAQAPPLRIGPW